MPRKFIITFRDSAGTLPKLDFPIMRDSALEVVDAAIRKLRLHRRQATVGANVFDSWEIGIARGRLSASTLAKGNDQSTVDEYKFLVDPPTAR
jgi:hypothetical protein